MTPIINPWLLYLIGFVENISILFLIFTVIFSVLTVVLITNVVIEGGKIVFPIVTGTLLVVVSVVLLFVPSSDTVLKMIIAQNITEERVDNILENSGNVKNELKQDIIDILNAIDSFGN